MTEDASVSTEYSDCALRLACLAGRRGDYPEAREWIERAMKYRSGQRDAQSLQGMALGDRLYSSQISCSAVRSPAAVSSPVSISIKVTGTAVQAGSTLRQGTLQRLTRPLRSW